MKMKKKKRKIVQQTKLNHKANKEIIVSYKSISYLTNLINDII